ncbi:MAG: heparinase II/III family protein [Phycisphaerales bacterium]
MYLTHTSFRAHVALWCMFIVGSVFAQSGNTAALLRPVPINVAEAIIEPFWTPDLSGFAKWRVEPGTDHGLRIRQNWSAVDFEWASKPRTGPALRMTRDFSVDCSGYDRLLVRLSLPAGCVLRVFARTDKGERTFVSEPAAEKRAEYAVDLDGAARLDALTLEIEAGSEGSAAGWLRWIGLQNTKLLPQYFAQWDYSGMRWDAYIRSDGFTPSFTPRYGIFMTAEELEKLRDEQRRAVEKDGRSPYASLAETARDYQPETGIHEFVKSGGSTSAHTRVRDEAQPKLAGSTDLAVAGLVLRDGDLLRMAARYALCLALSEHWETGFMSVFPGGPWEDRAFRRSYTAEDIATILDLAGEVLTEAGRTYLMRRLAEEGVGPINYVTWRHEYVFHCNQLAYFNTGRMCAYLVLEREWPRVKPYTDLAYRDAIDNLETVIEPDGGTLEGPSYFSPIARENYTVLRFYARARDRNVSELVPDVLKRTSDYAAVVASTTADDVIPICDSGSSFRADSLSILAELMPQSHWAAMYGRQLVREGKPPLESPAAALPAFIALPETGYLASVRMLGGDPVKIFVMGNKAGAGHTHEDKGSFVLEYAGETFAMDLGICDYDDPIHAIYKHCQRHNMLLPVGLSERACPQNPLPFDVKPTGQGDEQAFHASLDATAGWQSHYKKWVRHWDSPAPDKLVIRDAYELGEGTGVEFYWQTKLPVEREGQTVTIRGVRGIVSVTAPSDCTIRIEELALADGDKHNRIAIRKEATQGTLEVTIGLCRGG